LNDEQFRIKFITLSIVVDLLNLKDTFATNPWNYGSILQSKNTELQYSATLFDHEIKEECFEFQPDKNPVISLLEKLKASYYRFSFKGKLISYRTIKDVRCFENPVNLKS
jgi:hypothetical protein